MGICLKVSQEIAELFPRLRIGVIKGTGLKNAAVDAALALTAREAEQQLRNRMSLETMLRHQHILAWQEAYRRFGVKPNRHKPTCEALLRRVLKGDSLPLINMIVNCYLIAELEHLLPCGGYDTDAVRGDIELRISKGNEAFTPIGGVDVESTNVGEIVYGDDGRILTRNWNYRDCDMTKITTNTNRLVLMTEAPFETISTDAILQFMSSVSQMLSKFCKAKIETQLLDVRDGLCLDL